ncbi:hypothetical protein CDAR_537231 [Caerostris darwini]|uniref:Uncharacterized protein n=1 Tax=Caerostris darwini TaxID=1538125 RepID=A0AAV4TZA8_9ARAC|nr:hypothetical protein CDAR_537231 [Caerostris darwini]
MECEKYPEVKELKTSSKVILERNSVKKSAKKEWLASLNPVDKTILNRFNNNIREAFEKFKNKEWKVELSELHPEASSLWDFAKLLKTNRSMIAHLNGHVSTSSSDKDKTEVIVKVLKLFPA